MSFVLFPPPAPCPKPFEGDKAYFSEVPKLVTIPMQLKKSLGLTIFTREVSKAEPTAGTECGQARRVEPVFIDVN